MRPLCPLGAKYRSALPRKGAISLCLTTSRTAFQYREGPGGFLVTTRPGWVPGSSRVESSVTVSAEIFIGPHRRGSGIGLNWPPVESPDLKGRALSVSEPQAESPVAPRLPGDVGVEPHQTRELNKIQMADPCHNLGCNECGTHPLERVCVVNSYVEDHRIPHRVPEYKQNESLEWT